MGGRAYRNTTPISPCPSEGASEASVSNARSSVSGRSERCYLYIVFSIAASPIYTIFKKSRFHTENDTSAAPEMTRIVAPVIGWVRR